jgi:hypothetical protein
MVGGTTAPLKLGVAEQIDVIRRRLLASFVIEYNGEVFRGFSFERAGLGQYTVAS